MATAKQEGGLYYDAVRKIMVDAEGKEVKGASKPGPDTPADQQPGAGGLITPEERMATAIATALRGGGDSGPRTGTGSMAAASEVTLADLPDHISKMSAAEVKALQKSDERKGAEPIYEKRLSELEG